VAPVAFPALNYERFSSGWGLPDPAGFGL